MISGKLARGFGEQVEGSPLVRSRVVLGSKRRTGLRLFKTTMVHRRKPVHRREKQGVRWFLCEPLATVEKKEKMKGQ